MHKNVALLVSFAGLLSFVGCAPSGNGESYAVKGMRFYEQRQFAEAISEFEKALEQPPADSAGFSRSDLLTTIGNCYNELERFEESLAYHDRAIAEDPGNHRAYVNKGVVYRLQGEFDQAKEMYLKALELAPDYAELHASMGALAIYQGEFAAAIEHLERALELDDSLAIAHSNLAFAYAAVERFDDAEKALKSAVIRGYHQPEVVRERIDQLRKAAGASK